jgi:hypothetical protein
MQRNQPFEQTFEAPPAPALELIGQIRLVSKEDAAAISCSRKLLISLLLPSARQVAPIVRRAVRRQAANRPG